jgi:hypothetical protein
MCIDAALRAAGAVDHSAMHAFLCIDTQEQPAHPDVSHIFRKPKESTQAHTGSNPVDFGRKDRLKSSEVANARTSNRSSSGDDEDGDADSLDDHNAASIHHETQCTWSTRCAHETSDHVCGQSRAWADVAAAAQQQQQQSAGRDSHDAKAREVWLPGYIDSYLEQPSVRNEYPRVHDFKPLQHPGEALGQHLPYPTSECPVYLMQISRASSRNIVCCMCYVHGKNAACRFRSV